MFSSGKTSFIGRWFVSLMAYTNMLNAPNGTSLLVHPMPIGLG
jgi:hypothetical protein